MRTKIICLLITLICIVSIYNSAYAQGVATPTDLDPISFPEQVIEETEPELVEEPEIIRIPPTVTVYWDAHPVMREGEEVHIYSIITNAEYWNLTYQWFYSIDGSNWILIPGATQPTYIFKATKETLSYSYRIEVTYRPLEE